MPNPLAHHPSMLIIRPDSLPRLWWLFPWSIARQLHKNAVAVKAMADRLHDAMTLQSRIISDQSAEIANLRLEVTRLAHSREHWVAKHDRAYAVAMHNERVIARLEDSITRGAITPDAAPYNAGSERDQDKPYTRADDLRISE
jgi:hypothetical protein